MSTPVEQVGALAYPQDLINFLNSFNSKDPDLSIKLIRYQLVIDQDFIGHDTCEMWRLMQKEFLRDTVFQGKAKKKGDKEYFLQAGLFVLVEGIWQTVNKTYSLEDDKLQMTNCPLSLISKAKKLSASH